MFFGLRITTKWILTVFGLTVTLTFDLLTSKCKQFIFVSKCTSVVNLVNFSQVVYEMCSQGRTLGRADQRKTWKHTCNAPGTVLTVAEA